MSATTPNYSELLNNIQSLQANEKRLYAELDTLPSHAGQTNLERQRHVVAQLDRVTSEKIQQFRALYAINNLLQADIARGNDDLANRLEVARLVEHQLKASQERLRKERNLNINNLRQTEINHYFSDRYQAFHGTFQSIVFVCVALVVIAALRRRYLLSGRVAHLLAAAAILVGLYYVLPAFWDIDSRNNMVFAEYDFEFDPHSSKNPQHADEDDLGLYGLKGLMGNEEKYRKDIQLLEEGDCIGPECCSGPGLKFDAKHEVCVVDKSKKNSETFGNISGQSGAGGASLADPATYSAHLVQTDHSGKYYSV